MVMFHSYVSLPEGIIHNHALINYDQLCKILQKSRDLFTEIAEGRWIAT